MPPSPLEDKYRDNVLYNGANYSMIDNWTRGPNGTRIFPVRIDITIRWNNGKADYISNRTVNSQTELDNMHTGLEKSIKELIDAENTPPGIKWKNTLELIQNWTDYNGSRYMIQLWWNTTGSTKTNYPTTVQGIYRSPKTGGNIELNYTVNSDSERTTKVTELPWILKGKIDAETPISPTPTCSLNEVKKENYTNYRGAYYQSVRICNTTGTADYPMKIHAEYTLPWSSTVYITPQPSTVYNDSQRSTETKYHLSIAQWRIDAVIDDQYPPGYTRTSPTEYYGGGSYFFTIDYTTTVWKDFPANLYATINNKNGTKDNLVLAGSGLRDEWQIDASIDSYKNYAKSQIDNYNPTYSANTTLSDGPYTYGSAKWEYTIKATYNRTGQNKNYPALIWIEFRERAGGILLDTRNIRAIWPKYANNSVEKESIKADLESQIKQRLALNTIDSSTLFAGQTRRSVMDMIIPSAYAQGTNYVTIQKSPTKYGVTFPDPTTAFTPFLANGTSANLYVKRQENKASVGARTTVWIDNILNQKIQDIMEKYASSGTMYMGDLPDSASSIMINIFWDIAKRVTADEIYRKYRDQLKNIGVSEETLAKMHWNILIVYSEGLTGAEDLTMEVVDLWMMATGVWAGFQLWRFVIYQVIKKATGEVLMRGIVGAGWAAFVKYEATMVAKWGYTMVDSMWNIIRLTKGDMNYWFEHIWTYVRSSGKTRVQEILDWLRAWWLPGIEKELGTELNSPYAFQKLIEKVIQNGSRTTSNSNPENWEYAATIGTRVFKVEVNKAYNTVTTLLKPW